MTDSLRVAWTALDTVLPPVPREVVSSDANSLGTLFLCMVLVWYLLVLLRPSPERP